MFLTARPPGMNELHPMKGCPGPRIQHAQPTDSGMVWEFFSPKNAAGQHRPSVASLAEQKKFNMPSYFFSISLSLTIILKLGESCYMAVSMLIFCSFSRSLLASMMVGDLWLLATIYDALNLFYIL